MTENRHPEQAVRGRQRGFTLIELMITVALVALLTSIGYPAYTGHVKKTSRRSAQTQILEIANREQQYLMANRNFATKDQLTAGGYRLPDDLAARYDWDITVGGGTVPAFTVTFTAKQTQLEDGNLQYTHDGVKLPAGKW